MIKINPKNQIRFLGVADGVGGWEQVGVDSGKFSRALVQNVSNFTKEIEVGEDSSPVKVMDSALKKVRATGSCTCCLAFLDSELVGENGDEERIDFDVDCCD